MYFLVCNGWPKLMLIGLIDRIKNEVSKNILHFFKSAAQYCKPHEFLCFPRQVDKPSFKQKSLESKHSTQTTETIRMNTIIFSFISKV